MPLNYGKSKKAFSANVSAEMHAGKPQKQALAIAFAVKRGESKPPKTKTPKAKLRVARKRHNLRMHELRATRTSRQRAKYFAPFVE